MLLSTGLIICNKSQKSSEKGSWETKTVEIIILKLIENAKYNYSNYENSLGRLLP